MAASRASMLLFAGIDQRGVVIREGLADVAIAPVRVVDRKNRSLLEPGQEDLVADEGGNAHSSAFFLRPRAFAGFSSGST